MTAATLAHPRVRRARAPRLTDALRTEHAQFSAIIVPALGSRTRLVADVEGWPMVPGATAGSNGAASRLAKGRRTAPAVSTPTRPAVE